MGIRVTRRDQEVPIESRTETVTMFRDVERRAMEAYGVDYESRFVDLERPAMRVRVIEAGEGDPVLLVHGLLADAAFWIPLIAELTDRRVLAVDLPGYGLSDPYVYERGRIRPVAVDVLDSVIDALGFESLPVIANSMGGLWTFWLALDRPSRVDDIVQIGCPAVILHTSAPLPMRVLSVRGLNRLVVRMLPAPDGSSELRQMGDDEAAETAPEEFLRVMEASEGFDAWWPASLSLLEGLARLTGQRIGLDESELASIEQPTLFVWGSNDPFGSVATGERAASLVPDARFVEVEGGHLPWVARSEEVARHVRSFLDRDR